MTGDPERDKLDQMAARIRREEIAPKPAGEMPSAAMGADTIRASRLGFDFAATVLVCVAAGWGIDWEFGTGPWGVLTMLLAGFAAAVVKLWRSLQ